MARRKNTRRFDPRYFMDEKTEKLTESRELENAPITGTYEEQGYNDAEKAMASGELTLNPRYKYPSDILPSGRPLGRENYRDYMNGWNDALEAADDAEARRQELWDDYYDEREAAPLDPYEEEEQEDRYRDYEDIREGFLDFLKRSKGSEEAEPSVEKAKPAGPSLNWRELSKEQFMASGVKNPLYRKELRDGVEATLNKDLLSKEWQLTVRLPGMRPFIHLKDVGYDEEQAKNYAFELLQSKDGRPPADGRNKDAWKKLYAVK
jgi:hypothetical protein